PRPSERFWRGFGTGLEPGDTLRAAFTAPDGPTYFFFAEQYAKYVNQAFDALAPIRGRWGKSLNPFVADDGTARVDAAVVCQDRPTFLSSGDHHVPYTGSESRSIDPGSPKKIIGNLRHEPALSNLQEAFEESVTDRMVAGDKRLILGALSNSRTVYL